MCLWKQFCTLQSLGASDVQQCLYKQQIYSFKFTAIIFAIIPWIREARFGRFHTFDVIIPLTRFELISVEKGGVYERGNPIKIF